MANLIPGTMTVLYAAKETSYGTPRKITGTEAFRTISETFTPSEEREVRPDRSGSSDHADQYTGRKSAEWEITKLMLTSGAVTILPDDHFLWEAGFGNVSLGTTAIEYVQATAHTTSLTIRRGVRGDQGIAGAAELQEHVSGAIVNRMEFTWGTQGNANLAQVSFSGPAKEWGFTGNTSISVGDLGLGTGHAGVVTLDSIYQVTPGSVIKIGDTDTAGGSGALLLSTNITNGTTSWGGAGVRTGHASHADDVAVMPYNPTESTSGDPIHAKVGLFSLDGSATEISHLGGRITVEDNRSLLMDEVGEDSASQVYRNAKRDVTFSFEFLVKRNEVGDLIGGMYNNTASDIQLTLGNGTGQEITFVMPKCKYDMAPIDIGEESARFSLNGRSFQKNGNDSLKVRIR